MASSLSFLIRLKPPNSHRCLQLNHDVDLPKVRLLKYLPPKSLFKPLCKCGLKFISVGSLHQYANGLNSIVLSVLYTIIKICLKVSIKS